MILASEKNSSGVVYDQIDLSSSESINSENFTPLTSTSPLSLNIHHQIDCTQHEFNYHKFPEINLNTYTDDDSVCKDLPKEEEKGYNWSVEEILLIYRSLKEKKPIDVVQFTQKSKRDLSKKIHELSVYVERLEKIQENGLEAYGEWEDIEMAKLFKLQNEDLTAETLAKEIPNKTGSQCRGKLLQFNGSVRWTDSELDIIKKAAIDGIDLKQVAIQLPIRTLQSVQSKLSNHKSKILNCKSRQKMEIWSESQEILLKDISQTDLTAKSIRKHFSNVSIETLATQLKKIGFKEEILTPGEFEELQVLANDKNLKISTIKHHLPLRSEEFLIKQINALRTKTKDQSKPIEIRRKNFKNSVDELVYYAQWFTSDIFSNTGRRSRRSTKPAVDIENLSHEAAKFEPKTRAKRELTEEELELRKIKKAKLEAKRRAESEARRQKRLETEKRRKERIELGIYKPQPLKAVLTLKDEAKYFQSVTGTHQEIKEGETRLRKQREIYKPESSVTIGGSNRHKLKMQKKKLDIESIKAQSKKTEEERKERKRPKKSELQTKKPMTDIKIEEKDIEELVKEQKEQVQEREEKENDEQKFESVSEFDPYDINTDTQIPMFDRQLFINEIKNYTSLPDLQFDMEETMKSESEKIPLFDNSAAEVILQFKKCYNNLPISFPPLIISQNNELVVNPLNRVRVRHLLYPMHCETYILAAPKSNELDPITEIQRLFQIHYALYFSHSEKIKQVIIDEYCRKLDEYVANNDFAMFLHIIDRWNALMVELSPNSSSVSLKEDVNLEVRFYVQNDYIESSELEKHVQLFMDEIVEELPSPEFESGPPSMNNPKKIDLTRCKNSGNQPNMEVFTYKDMFFKNLNEKKTISRFCMQQILLRIYARVVSPASGALRSYKAFTAEVYGELLPSFISEVLTKVDLRPNQKFYDLGSGVGNTTLQAALEFGAKLSGGCELMEHASNLTKLQDNNLRKTLKLFGLKQLQFSWVLNQSFVDNPKVKEEIIDCDVIIVNNFLFDANLNAEVGRLLYGLKPGTKIISLRNFIRPRYKSTGEKVIFDFFKVEKHEMSDYMSVSWTANKVPYFISTVQENICPEYL